MILFTNIKGIKVKIYERDPKRFAREKPRRAFESFGYFFKCMVAIAKNDI